MMLAPFLLLFIQSPQEAPAVDPQGMQLAHALRDAAQKTGIHFQTTVTEHTPDGGDGPQAIRIGAGGGGAKFSGEIDAWRTAKNELFLLSKKRLPELALFDDGTQAIVRTTCGDEALDSAQTCTDLTAMLDLGAMSKTIETMAGAGGNPKFEKSGGAGQPQQFACELPVRIIKPGGGMTAMAMPKVMRIEARFVLDDKGVLDSMRFDVVRSDPFGQIRRHALEGGMSTSVLVKPGDVGDEVGPTSVYEVKIDTQVPEKRAQVVLESLRETAASAGR